MVSARSLRKPLGVALALSAFALVSSTSDHASAGFSGASEVSPTGKGIAGGALLGGEIGYLSLAAANAQKPWLYYTLPPLLAIGGGIGGYYVEQSVSTADVPLFMLAGGMAMVIPTVVITLSATSYRPGTEDSTPSDATPADASATVNVGGGGAGASVGGGAGTSTTGPATGPAKHKPATTSLRTPPPARSFALVSYDHTGDALQVGVPAVGFKPAYTINELAKFGVVQRYEVHAPIVNVTF